MNKMENLINEMENLMKEIARLKARLAETEMALERRHAAELDRIFGEKAREAGLPELFDRFRRSIEEAGWEDVYDQWTSDEAPSSRAGRSGSSCTVIPGKGGACNETVVVLIDSRRHWWFDPERYLGHRRRRIDELEALKLHLVECQRVRGVLIITDMIHGDHFRDEVMPWIRAWEQRGVAFALTVVSPGGRHAAPVSLA